MMREVKPRRHLFVLVMMVIILGHAPILALDTPAPIVETDGRSGLDPQAAGMPDPASLVFDIDGPPATLPWTVMAIRRLDGRVYWTHTYRFPSGGAVRVQRGAIPLSELRCWPEGEYDVVVVGGEDQVLTRAGFTNLHSSGAVCLLGGAIAAMLSSGGAPDQEGASGDGAGPADAGLREESDTPIAPGPGCPVTSAASGCLPGESLRRDADRALSTARGIDVAPAIEGALVLRSGVGRECIEDRQRASRRGSRWGSP